MSHDPEQFDEFLPEWDDTNSDGDDAAWVAAIEAARREQFQELANL